MVGNNKITSGLAPRPSAVEKPSNIFGGSHESCAPGVAATLEWG